MNTNSIRFKTSILYSGILCIILTGFSVFLYQAVKQILYQNVEEELRIKAEQIISTVNAYGEISKGKLPAMSLMRQFLSETEDEQAGQIAIDKLWEKHRWMLGVHNDFFRIIDISGESVLQSEDLPAGAGMIFDHHLSIRAGADDFANLRFNGMKFRGISYPFTFNYHRPFVLQLVVPLTAVDRALARLLFVMIIGIAGILLMSLFIGAFLAQKILRPVEEVTRTASNISQKNLGVRIEEQTRDHEMRLLVDSFNQMIGRLEKSFTHINEFSSHVAHELKTPLAIIKGELELALSDENSREDDRRVMTVALQEIDRLIKVIKDLLLLAKFDYKLDIFRMERMDLGAFLKDIHQHGQVLANEKNIQFNIFVPEKALWAQGDVVHLRRLFFNLIHNAVKFTPSGGRIEIKVANGGGHVQVAISDTGVGIAPEDHSRIFEKFFRGHRSGDSETPGTGLGLCLARSIARAHGGDIVFESTLNQGTTFTVSLPLSL